MLARKGDPIRAFVTLLTVPLPPISTCPAYLTVPGIAILDHSIPAKRVPIRLATFWALVIIEKLTEQDRSAITGQFVLFCQLFFRKGLVLVNVLDGTNRQGLHIHAVQWVMAVGAGAVLVTRLIVLETSAASGSTARLALAVYCFSILLSLIPLPVLHFYPNSILHRDRAGESERPDYHLDSVPASSQRPAGPHPPAPVATDRDRTHATPA